MKSILKFSILLIVLLGCQREKPEYLGPAQIYAPAGFNASNFTATPTSIDFTTGTVTFNADFTSSVTWIITIKGKSSGAVCELRGIASSLNNAIWKGQHDGIIFFKTGEMATATLSFYGTSQTLSVDIEIVKAANFSGCGTFPRNADMEDTAQLHFPYWARFNSPGAEQGTADNAIDYKGNVVPPVQGKFYYYIKGLGNQQVFVDGIQYIGPLTPVLPADADKVWINMFIYGTGDANCSVDLEYQENDLDGVQPGYQGWDDDAFVAHITLDHKGWKLFSFQYSKLTPSANAEFGGSGNHIHEPNRLSSFDLVLLKKSNPNSPVEVYFDYPIITVGGPFKPCF